MKKVKKITTTIGEPQDGNDQAMDAIAYALRDMEKKPIRYAGVR